MDEDGHVLVIGAASLDIKGRPETTPIRGSSTPGFIRISPGGVARNIAENLARLEVDTILLTAIGDDDAGERILGQAAGSGVDISEVLVIEEGHTGAYMGMLNQRGLLEHAIDDMGVLEAITPPYLTSRRDLFESAAMVAIDANLSDQSLSTVVHLCREANVPLSADPTSNLLAKRLCPYLDAYYMVSPNIAEAHAMVGGSVFPTNNDAIVATAAQLVAMGVDICVVTLAEFGVIYASEETRGHIPAMPTQIVDPTGAGDAMTAAIIFGLLEDIPLDECVRLGINAASLTLRSSETVRRDLSVDRLYEESTE